MGFKQAAVLAPVSFFLGVQLICLNVDHRLLWGELTEDVIRDGFQFYTTFFNAPPAIKALLHGLVGVGLIGLVAKLHKWDESALFFDGTCLATYVFGIAVYLTVTIPSLRTIVTAVEQVDSRGEQVDAMRVLSAGNVIIIICLGLILALQAGQEYARRKDCLALAAGEKKEQ
ncbi:hypothetical protein K443DRAFT_672990 [Laccaria amethystina LaAM-08-1]|uniref:Shr3 amino acid permease chaperone n=1 Tax=Laccaria amethystina LaAM-08-1 TaxID=1095629 RepID=A0A0C9YI54_9AGAR|nr:hypothetical protein K443DRAFT_672990 [Laccaria amethystina LaAM-08-1]